MTPDVAIGWGQIAYWATVLVPAYLLGSIPFGLILGRLAGVGDVRRGGSGNVGATNVLRTGRRRLALATLILDAAKGTLAVVLATRFGPEPAGWAALTAVAGHTFPVWLRFRGGKGVATTYGALLGPGLAGGASNGSCLGRARGDIPQVLGRCAGCSGGGCARASLGDAGTSAGRLPANRPPGGPRAPAFADPDRATRRLAPSR